MSVRPQRKSAKSINFIDIEEDENIKQVEIQIIRKNHVK